MPRFYYFGNRLIIHYDVETGYQYVQIYDRLLKTLNESSGKVFDAGYGDGDADTKRMKELGTTKQLYVRGSWEQ